ncbi:MAG TPA: cyclopropane-fatty-acyl-phospholipid synthase family protein [Burkholderiales bacterium]|nr:cyclopropane-fatty-acyl-phospholipid synthase family protein [Burkholderiales bacterium]
MFLENRFERTIDRLRARVAIPARIELWNGRCFDLSAEPTVTIGIPKPSALRYFIAPDLNKLGEAFVEGYISVKGPIHDIFKVGERLAQATVNTTRKGFHLAMRHTRERDRAAVAHHYDVSNDFYGLFLDRNMVYSCAYYRDESDTLETAQIQKLDHILRKLALKPGERLLDIGCGWGALILRAAQQYGAIATGVTLSRNQFEYAQERIRAAGLQDRCQVHLLDYRDIPGDGTFDKIASVGMFEHVGLKNLPAYFAKVHALLKDGGLVLNHGITTSDIDSGWMGLGAGEFIDRYVFPEGELPHLSLVLKDIAAAGLEVTDAESLRRHYARTCHAWAGALESNHERAVAEAGEKRVRIWQIYLAGCAYGFAHGWMNVYQVLACKSGSSGDTPLPLTRDYMYGPDAGA